MRFVGLFVLVFVLLLLFFYAYPAEIFNADIKNEFATINADITLRTLLFKEDFPNGIMSENVNSVKLTLQGWLFMAACLIGLPAMVALRFGRKVKE